MNTKAKNILQLEFFNVNIESNSLDNVLQECSERIADGLESTLMGMQVTAGIKTVIRVYDLDLTVTKYALEIKRLERESNNLYTKTRTTFIGKIVDYGRQSWNRKRIESLKTKIRTYVSTYVSQALHTRSDVAIERADRKFRNAKHSELYELDVAIQKKNYWLFIFKPNDILSDKNESVVSVM
jgi:hypothetical protein